MYQALGLPWIPPELREDQGEMEAAQAGKLPRLVELAQIKGDLQCHSDWSDGRDTILEMATAAAARGLKYLAITDHSRSSYQANGMTAERAARQREEIEQARRRLPKGFTLLAGCEVDILKEGALDFPDKLLAGFDLVVASVHSGFKADRATMTKRIVAALENPWVDVLAHPTGRLIGQRDPYEVDMEAVLKAAARQGVAVEINAFPDRLDLKDVHARRAKELGVKIVINTDSHRPEHLDYMKFGVATARRGWLESSDVLTTRPWSRLRKQLRRHRGRAAK
jgi:DNA polymerase (family 10)